MKEIVCVNDCVVLDIIGYTDAGEFEEGYKENFQLIVGKDSFIKGFDSNLIGLKLNQTIEFDLVYPVDYEIVYLRSVCATFRVTVKEIK